MPEMQNMKRKTAQTVLFAFLISFTLFALFFIVIEADHDCYGENCAVCLIIQISQQNMQLLRLILCGAATSFAFFSRQTKSLSRIQNIQIEQFSLFSQKIRLND